MTSHIIQTLLGTTILLALALLMLRCLQKRSAAMRHAVMACAMTGTLFVPLLAPFVPQIPLVVRPETPPVQNTAQNVQPPVIL